MLRQLVNKLKKLYYTSSSGKYVLYLKKLGMSIGDNTTFLSCGKTHIDEGRARFISIGSNCVICTGVTILAHDYSWSVLRRAYSEVVPSGGGPVSIGNNCFIGENAMILRNCKIGSNCIIGAGSVVTKDIPDNCVAAGVPARVIMSLEEYRQKRKDTLLDEVRNNIDFFRERCGRLPTEAEMGNFNILFKPRNEQTKREILQMHILGGNPEDEWEIYRNCPPMFSSYGDMLSRLGYQ